MIYDRLKDTILTLIRAPRQPPDPPAGSEGSIKVFRAAPNFLKYQVIVWGLGFAAGILAELVFFVIELSQAGDEESRWAELAVVTALLVLTVIGAVVKYFLIRIDYDMRYYVVTDRSLRIREGALIIHEATYTFANVQNLEIRQGPIERLLGLANLQVETAGGGGASSGDKRQKSPFGHGHQGVLRGIVNAREVRDQVLVLLKRYRDAGLGDPEDRRRADLAGAAGFPAAAIERLREVLAEVRGLAATLGPRS